MNRQSIAKPLVGLLLLFMLTAPAFSIPVFFSFGGEKISKVAEFPNTEEFNSQYGYYNAGVKYKQVSIFFIPLWNYDKQWCGSLAKKDTYLMMSEAQVREMAAIAKVELPENPKIPAWDAYGGKVLFAVLILGYFMLGVMGKKEEEYESSATLDESNPPVDENEQPAQA